MANKYAEPIQYCDNCGSLAGTTGCFANCEPSSLKIQLFNLRAVIDTLTADLAKKSDLYAGVKTLCEQQIEQNQRLREMLDDAREYLVEMNHLDGVAYNRSIIISKIEKALEGEG